MIIEQHEHVYVTDSKIEYVNRTVYYEHCETCGEKNTRTEYLNKDADKDK